MSRNQGTDIQKEQLDLVLNLLWRDSALWNCICTSAWYDKERLRLLYQILRQLALRKTEGLESQVYSYGSMIKERDLAARQMFIWLLRMVEEISREEKEQKE